MHVRCSHCHAGYTLPAEKLSPGRRVQFGCRHCGQRIVVQVPGEEPVAAPSPAPADEPRWFVAAPDGSYRKLAESELEAAIGAGEVAADQLVWCKGFEEWLPAGQSERWRALFGRDQTSVDAPAAPEPGAVRRRERRRTEMGVGEAAVPEQESMPEATRMADVLHTPAKVPSFAVATEAPTIADDPEVSAAVLPRSETESTASMDALPEEDAGDIAGSTIAGVGTSDAGQAAVSLPIVRTAARAESAPIRRDSGLHRARPRLSPRQNSSAAPAPAPAPAPVPTAAAAPRPAQPPPGQEGNWAPGTDTYVGPRDNFTRRLGSAAERDALLMQVELGKQQGAELRRWQAVTVAACGVAFVALLLAAWAMLERRAASHALQACQHGAPAATVAAP